MSVEPGDASTPVSAPGAAVTDATTDATARSGGASLAARATAPLGGGVRHLGGYVQRAGILIPFVILFVVLSIASGSFLTETNLLNILDQQASTLMVAAAGTLVLVSGGLDLSTGAVYGLAAVVTAELLGHMPVGFAILIGIVVGLAAGTLNGIITTFFRINALIATLATFFVLTGVASLVTQGNLLVLSQFQSYGKLANTNIIGVNSSTWLMVIVVVVLGLALARTTLGRYMYAAGGNAEAARLAGVRVNLTRIIAFALSGGAAAFGGIIDSSRVLSAGDQNGLETFTFTVLAGIVVGGTSILGGEGVVWRTVVGVLLIALIGNGFDLLGLNPLWEQIMLGAIMLAAVGIDAWVRYRR
ncbi:MAG: ABC transporter permease [Solirubrobacteraceae bacterium]